MGARRAARSLPAGMELLPIAHAGHWFEGALYLAPVLILIVVLLWQGRGGDDVEIVESSGDARSAGP
jgi:hypothetical protein